MYSNLKDRKGICMPCRNKPNGYARTCTRTLYSSVLFFHCVFTRLIFRSSDIGAALFKWRKKIIIKCAVPFTPSIFDCHFFCSFSSLLFIFIRNGNYYQGQFDKKNKADTIRTLNSSFCILRAVICVYFFWSVSAFGQSQWNSIYQFSIWPPNEAILAEQIK